MIPPFIPDISKNNWDDTHVNLTVWDDSEEIANQQILLRKAMKKKERDVFE